MRSTDDKAYLCPGTSEEFSNTRNWYIWTPTDVDKARALPKYDWPEKLVYQTPGARKIFSKSSTMSDIGEKKMITEEDSHFVFVWPKAIVGSSGSTWASETFEATQFWQFQSKGQWWELQHSVQTIVCYYSQRKKRKLDRRTVYIHAMKMRGYKI